MPAGMSGLTIGLAASSVGAVPLLAVLASRPRGSAWWWLAAAFAVSLVADVAALAFGHPLLSQVYPVAQSGLFALVLAPTAVAVPVVGVVLAAAGISVAWREAAGLDFLLHAVAWGSTAALAWHYLMPSAIRTALLVGFGGGVVAWTGFVLDPGWTWWLVYQSTRVLAAGWFAVAVWQSPRGHRAAT